MFAQATDLSAFQRIHKKAYVLIISLSFSGHDKAKASQRTSLDPKANLASLLTFVFSKVDLA